MVRQRGIAVYRTELHYPGDGTTEYTAGQPRETFSIHRELHFYWRLRRRDVCQGKIPILQDNSLRFCYHEIDIPSIVLLCKMISKFHVIFILMMQRQVVATSMLYGPDAYFTSGWNIMDGSLVIISIIDLSMSLLSSSSPRIFGILRVNSLFNTCRVSF